MPKTLCYVLFSLVFVLAGHLQGKIFLRTATQGFLISKYLPVSASVFLCQ